MSGIDGLERLDDHWEYGPAGYCPQCGYAMDAGRCPECGAEVPGRELRHHPRQHVRDRRSRWALRLLQLTFFALLGYAVYRAILFFNGA